MGRDKTDGLLIPGNNLEAGVRGQILDAAGRKHWTCMSYFYFGTHAMPLRLENERTVVLAKGLLQKRERGVWGML